MTDHSRAFLTGEDTEGPDPAQGSAPAPTAWAPLLDLPPCTDARLAALTARIARLIGTRGDVLLLPAGADVAREVVATSLAAPGMRVVNLITGPGGVRLSGWFARGGAAGSHLVTRAHLPPTMRARDLADPGLSAAITVGGAGTLGVTHAGQDARFGAVLTAVAAVGVMLRACDHPCDIGAAAEAVIAGWGADA